MYVECISISFAAFFGFASGTGSFCFRLCSSFRQRALPFFGCICIFTFTNRVFQQFIHSKSACMQNIATLSLLVIASEHREQLGRVKKIFLNSF